MAGVEQLIGRTKSFLYAGSTHSKKTVGDTLFANYKVEGERQKDEVTPENIGLIMKDMVDDIFDPTSAMTEEEKAEFVKQLQQKIENGDELSYDEMQYLRIHNPLEYAKMAKVQMQRKMLEEQLKHCKSKQEVQEKYAEAVSRVSRDDPTIKETYAAYRNVTEEFKKSSQYQSLPEREDEKEKKKQNGMNSASEVLNFREISADKYCDSGKTGFRQEDSYENNNTDVK